MSKDASPKMLATNVDIVHQGSEIILPIINGQPMSNDEGITWLQRKRDEEERVSSVHHEIPCSPLDGLVAFHRALAEKYGWAQAVPTPGFFGPNPPKMIGADISATERLNVPFGRIQIPGIDGHLSTHIRTEPKPTFLIGGEVKKKHTNHVLEIVTLTKRYLKEQSIYKGKAVRVAFDWLDDDGDIDRDYDPMEDAPKFLQLDGIKDDDLIFGDAVVASLNIGLFTPIEQTDACREYKIPLKRGVLLYGPFGTGKTMTAYVSAVKAVRNDWTFIYLDNVMHLKKGLEFAAQYAPAVLFAEDIDRAVNGERTVSMDEILNTIDGVDTKGKEVITVLTTNDVERINPALLRPGRLDTLVHVTPPDAKAAERLVELYARGLLAKNVNLEKVGMALEGKIPAVIREVTERAKIAAIYRTKGGKIEGKVLEEDLLNGAMAMESHVAMLTPKDADAKDTPEFLVRIPQNHPSAKEALSHFKPKAA